MDKIILKYSNPWKGIAFYGSENNSLIDKIVALLLTLSPILQHYIGLYENAGFTVYLIVSPFVIKKMITRINRSNTYKKITYKQCFIAMLPLILFEIYTIFNRSITVSHLLYGGFMAVLFLAIALGCVNIGYVLRWATLVADLAGVVVIAQCITYYVFRFEFRPIIFSLLHSDSANWLHTTSSGGAKLYRPEAFFMEPSHMFLYIFPIICLLLLLPNINKTRMKRAIFLSLAMVLCTSGMGICVTAGLWGLYFTVFRRNIKEKTVLNMRKLFSLRSLTYAGIFLVILVIAYFSVDSIRGTINRIFVNEEGSTAIDGRVRRASNLIKSLKGRSLIMGVPGNVIVGDLDMNLSGYHATLYKRGIIGIFLTYLYYGQGLFKLKNAYFWLTAIILVISFFTAHTHGTFFMVYYAFFLINGYYAVNWKKQLCLDISIQESADESR